MIIVTGAVLVIFAIHIFIVNNVEAKYLGENSSLKLKVKAQAQEIENLKKEIITLKSYSKYEPEV